MTTKGADLFQRYPANPLLTARDWPYPVSAVFNAGATIHDGQTVLLVRAELRVYYGGADKCIALATGSLKAILDYLPALPPARRCRQRGNYPGSRASKRCVLARAMGRDALARAGKQRPLALQA